MCLVPSRRSLVPLACESFLPPFSLLISCASPPFLPVTTAISHTDRLLRIIASRISPGWRAWSNQRYWLGCTVPLFGHPAATSRSASGTALLTFSFHNSLAKRWGAHDATRHDVDSQPEREKRNGRLSSRSFLGGWPRRGRNRGAPWCAP